ncbi:MAG: metallophosphoesterase family protein [bacterium]
MKFAVISDIHGNLNALETTLNDIKEIGAEKIYILGDLAMAGAEPSETIDFIRELAKENNVSIIQGNTDEMIVNYFRTQDEKYFPPNEIMTEALKYATDLLITDQIDFLETLPPQLSENIGLLKILFVHGSPRRNNEDIMPDISQEKLEKVLKDIEADIIFCGHTHIPAKIEYKEKTIINTGSVGRPFTEIPDASYVVIDYPDFKNKDFTVIHRALKYDNIKVADTLKKLPFKGADKLAEMLINPTERYPKN